MLLLERTEFPDSETLDLRSRITQLEIILCELLVKNEQLRLNLHLAYYQLPLDPLAEN
jgi:hypothetical protein